MSSRVSLTFRLPPFLPDMDEYEHVDLVMPNVPVVRGEPELDQSNAFICSYFDMEVLGKDMGFTSDDKVHMVGYEPVISDGNEKYLHHFTLFTCEGYADGQGLDDSHLYHQKFLPSCTTIPPECQSFLGGVSRELSLLFLCASYVQNLTLFAFLTTVGCWQ